MCKCNYYCYYYYYDLIICMLLGSYLIVITERECVGSYLGHPIYKVASLKILPCDHSLNNSPAEQVSLLLLLLLIYSDLLCVCPNYFS